MRIFRGMWVSPVSSPLPPPPRPFSFLFPLNCALFPDTLARSPPAFIGVFTCVAYTGALNFVGQNEGSVYKMARDRRKGTRALLKSLKIYVYANVSRRGEGGRGNDRVRLRFSGNSFTARRKTRARAYPQRFFGSPSVRARSAISQRARGSDLYTHRPSPSDPSLPSPPPLSSYSSFFAALLPLREKGAR